ncbi:unnamed protein product [Heterobilharzia americana]|nr:unnamed protein product [Heterobilharzia americana]
MEQQPGMWRSCPTNQTTHKYSRTPQPSHNQIHTTHQHHFTSHNTKYLHNTHLTDTFTTPQKPTHIQKQPRTTPQPPPTPPPHQQQQQQQQTNNPTSHIPLSSPPHTHTHTP